MILEEEPLASPCDASPNSVTPDIPHGLPPLCFYQPVPRYTMMKAAHAHIGATTDREDMEWALSRWWIKRWRSCASGAA